MLFYLHWGNAQQLHAILQDLANALVRCSAGEHNITPLIRPCDLDDVVRRRELM